MQKTSAVAATLLRSASRNPVTRPASLHFSYPHSISRTFPAPTRARVAARWYSSAQADAQKPAESAQSPAGETSAKEAKPEEDAKQKEIDARNKEIIELKDKYLRSVADYRNLQERTRREIQAGKDFAIQKFARDLIESVDNFDLALSNVPKEKLDAASPTDGSEDPYKDLKQLHGGLKMTESVLMSTLKKHGLERFDPSEKGEKFDPNLHEATFQTPQPDKEDGSCFYTTQKGFTLNGRVLRAAKVGVVKNS